jgi:hypothetical protein
MNNLVVKPEGNRPLRNLGSGWRIMLKKILKKENVLEQTLNALG